MLSPTIKPTNGTLPNEYWILSSLSCQKVLVHVLTEHHAPWPSPEQQTYNVQTHLVNCSTDWRPPPARAHPFKRFLDKVPDPQTGDRLLHRASMGNTRKKGVEIFQLNVYFWILPPQLTSARLPAKHASECSATYAVRWPSVCRGIQVPGEEWGWRRPHSREAGFSYRVAFSGKRELGFCGLRSWSCSLSAGHHPPRWPSGSVSNCRPPLELYRHDWGSHPPHPFHHNFLLFSRQWMVSSSFFLHQERLSHTGWKNEEKLQEGNKNTKQTELAILPQAQWTQVSILPNF